MRERSAAEEGVGRTMSCGGRLVRAEGAGAVAQRERRKKRTRRIGGVHAFRNGRRKCPQRRGKSGDVHHPPGAGVAFSQIERSEAAVGKGGHENGGVVEGEGGIK